MLEDDMLVLYAHFVVSQTRLSFIGPETQSGNPANAWLLSSRAAAIAEVAFRTILTADRM